VTPVFVDTSGFFALYSATDAYDQRVSAVFVKGNDDGWRLVTSNTVVVETYSLLLNRTREGRPRAIQFLDDIDASELHVERVSEEDEKAAIALVRAHKDKSYSLCDAQSFILCERLGISETISCDDDFRSYGRFNVMP
jgi:predicted nucleic acid-binding protein